MSGGICRLFEPKLVQHCDAYGEYDRDDSERRREPPKQGVSEDEPKDHRKERTNTAKEQDRPEICE